VGGLADHLLIDVGYLIPDADRSGPTNQRSYLLVVIVQVVFDSRPCFPKNRANMSVLIGEEAICVVPFGFPKTPTTGKSTQFLFLKTPLMKNRLLPSRL
jgi:hypothetical protein